MKSNTRSSKQDIERRLMGYALTAGAALVATPNAGAAVVTRLVNLSIPTASVATPDLRPNPVGLDVDNDGIDDFLFSNLMVSTIDPGCTDTCTAGLVTVDGTLPANQVWSFEAKSGVFNIGLTAPKATTSVAWGPDYVAAKLSQTDPQNPLHQAAWVGFANTTVGGQLVPLKTQSNLGAYYALPLTFDISGSQHWGWARIQTTFAGPNTLNASILDVGYETTADAPIDLPDPASAPEPGTLGMLALGAAGLAMTRRKRQSE